ncbi:FAD-dependent thymidylate synthase, partial [bacterium]|nr:FAD-dependent thymidylate synthase [bacterium]
MAELEKLKRASVPELNQILGIPFKVLDDGFVRVIDYMGTDASIVQAARVSYGKGTKKVRQDRELIRYLMRHWHTSPFEMCEIKLHVRVPMDTWRQWIRHRTASVNEYSTRYSVAIDSQQMTKPKEWRVQGIENRQGSAGFIDAALGKELTEQEKNLQRLSREVYEFRLESAVAREQARKDLPLSTYTEAYWKIDLHNLLHFLRLRMDDKAQLEIRSFALVIGHEIVARWCPLIWESFLDYRMESL